MSANYFVKILWSLDFTGFTGIFHLLSHSIFLIWPHFYDKSLEKYIRLIFLPHFTTTTYGLYHSRYGFWQVHFRHLVLHMRLLCNMIIDIHCDLCIWMFFALLRSVLNGSPPDIQRSITYCITFGLTLFSPSLVHPVWRRVCGELGGIRFSSLCLRNAAYTIRVIGMSLIPASLEDEAYTHYSAPQTSEVFPAVPASVLLSPLPESHNLLVCQSFIWQCGKEHPYVRCLKIHNMNVSQSISYPVVPHTDIILFHFSFLFKPALPCGRSSDS